jgi:hypothetical protein
VPQKGKRFVQGGCRALQLDDPLGLPTSRCHLGIRFQALEYRFLAFQLHPNNQSFLKPLLRLCQAQGRLAEWAMPHSERMNP